LIVCEDGSIDGSLEAWDKRLQGRNEFMIRSNDLHEIRAYTRAADYARGNLLFFMQDDDIPPKSDWVEPVLEIFDQYPSLGLVGGFLPLAFGPFPDIDAYDLSGLNSLLEPDGNYYHRPHRDHPFPYSDTATGHKFMFCPAVNVGPFVVRNETYEQLGFDFDYSEAGMPGIEFDRDFSYRCWLNGWKVGYMPMGFAGYKGVSQVTGGTFQWGGRGSG